MPSLYERSYERPALSRSRLPSRRLNAWTASRRAASSCSIGTGSSFERPMLRMRGCCLTSSCNPPMPKARSQSLAPGLIVRLSGSVQWIAIPSLGINPRGSPGLSLKRLRPGPPAVIALLAATRVLSRVILRGMNFSHISRRARWKTDVCSVLPMAHPTTHRLFSSWKIQTVGLQTSPSGNLARIMSSVRPSPETASPTFRPLLSIRNLGTALMAARSPSLPHARTAGGISFTRDWTVRSEGMALESSPSASANARVLR